MTIRTLLMTALIVTAAVGAPTTVSVAAPRALSVDAASDAADQAVVESLYRAFAAHDGAAIAALLTADLVWMEAEGHPYADRNPYNGPAAVFEGVLGRIGAEFAGFMATPATYLAGGGRVAVLGRYSGTHNVTGEALDAQFVHVFTVSDGKITRFQQYTDTAQWVDVMTPD